MSPKAPLILLFLWICDWNAIVAQTPPSIETAGAKFKNVQVLKEMPADQMGKVMNMMSASLGVSCQHCHAGTDFAKEGVGHKEEGRRMLAMTLGLNRDYFKSGKQVTCNTCHRGQKIPVAPILMEMSQPSPMRTNSNTKPTAETIMANYLEALGGKEKLEAIKGLHVVASRMEPDGRTEPEELWQLADGKSRMVTHYGKIAVVEGYDGERVWKRANENEIRLKPDEAMQIRMESAIAFGIGIQKMVKQMDVAGVEIVEGREAYTIEAKKPDAQRERLYFDCASSLLCRRISSVPTVLGEFEYQVDYQEYKEFNGVKRPTKIRFSMPNIRWTRQVTRIDEETSIDDSMFGNR